MKKDGTRKTVIMYVMESGVARTGRYHYLSSTAEIDPSFSSPVCQCVCRTVKQDIVMEMSMPYVIQRSNVPFPYKLWKACAVTWNDVTIIWGGIKGGPKLTPEEAAVYCFISGEWIMKETSGDVPQKCVCIPSIRRYCGGTVCSESSLRQWRAPPQVGISSSSRQIKSSRYMDYRGGTDLEPKTLNS